jgi:polyhydroxybutyrate depolymerase
MQGLFGRGAAIRALAIIAGLCIPWSSLSAAAMKTEKLTVGGVEREYFISGASSQGPRPTVLVLHGSLLNAQLMIPAMGFQPLVEREGLVAVYPNAINGQWNDGRAAAALWSGGRHEDVAFLRALVAHLISSGTSDPERVYVTGYSNGGMMAFRLMCETNGIFAGAAAIAATLPAEISGDCKPKGPIPTLIMNGTADPFVPFYGGDLPFGSGRVLSTDATVRFLRKVNGCTEAAKVDALPDVDANDSSHVTLTSWTTCSSAAPVLLYKVEGGGHRIPSVGRGVPFADVLLGKLNHDFEAAEAIWSFFKDKTRLAAQWTRAEPTVNARPARSR